MTPFTLTLVVLLVNTLSPERKIDVPVESFWDCAGIGAQQRAVAWLQEHPKYRLVRTACRIGAAATEEAL